MVNISTHGENIFTISKCLTYEGIVQLFSRSCLGSPWDSQTPPWVLISTNTALSIAGIYLGEHNIFQNSE